MKKLIVDIDTGIDDAMALVQGLYAHRTGKAQILAITAVQGNAAMKDVVRNTYRILELCRTQDVWKFQNLFKKDKFFCKITVLKSGTH